MKKILRQKEVEGKRFYYFTLGRRDYFKPVYKVWVSDKLIKRDESGDAYIEIPMRNCQIVEMKNLVLKEGNYNMFIFEIECGYRGEAEIVEIKADDPELKYFKYVIYESERGSTGISAGVIILTKAEKVKISWERNGRLYGEPASGTTILYIDGKTEEIEEIDEELLREID